MAITATILGEAVQLAGNPVEIKCTGGSIPEGTTNYKILLKVISEDGKLTNFPKTDAITPDINGEALFDISGLVDQPVKAVFQYPPSGPIVSYATQAFNIQIQPGESWMDSEGVTQESWGSISSVFQILKGGISQRQLNMMRDAGTNFYQFYLTSGKFLTARPWGESVHPQQPVKLWFMPIASVSATFNVKGYYNDDSNSTHSTAVNLDKDKLYEFNCNPGLLGLDLEPENKRMKFFEVWLSSGGNIISEVFRFTIDWSYCERPVFMFFANTFGGADDVYLKGFIQDKFNVEGTTVYKPATREDSVYDPTLIVTNKAGQNKWSVNSGFKSLTYIQFLRDLMVTRQAWYAYTNVSQTTRIIIPVIIDNADKLLINRQKDLYAIDIEFSEAHTSQFSFDNRSY
jgi:hypothetical protein